MTGIVHPHNRQHFQNRLCRKLLWHQVTTYLRSHRQDPAWKVNPVFLLHRHTRQEHMSCAIPPIPILLLAPTPSWLRCVTNTVQLRCFRSAIPSVLQHFVASTIVKPRDLPVVPMRSIVNSISLATLFGGSCTIPSGQLRIYGWIKMKLFMTSTMMISKRKFRTILRFTISSWDITS